MKEKNDLGEALVIMVVMVSPIRKAIISELLYNMCDSNG
jgi:hypothetical protein